MSLATILYLPGSHIFGNVIVPPDDTIIGGVKEVFVVFIRVYSNPT